MHEHSATYSPEDDKLRLYFAYRIPRPEWDALRAEGWTWTMKQAEAGGCDMVAMWSPSREDKALELAGEIGDEDQPRAERAAQRAERFEAYGDKREGEAVAQADRYDAGPSIHAAQSAARAERSASRHDRVAGRAVNLWGKAEYWTRRTAGVIAHALYKERADVRHRRIKGIEADLHRLEAEVTPSNVLEGTEYVRRYCGDEYVTKGHDCVGMFGLGRAKHARSFRKGEGLKLSANGERLRDHLNLRLAYERQMLAAQGGTAADVVEIEAGGFYGTRRVEKVTKDRAGRVSKIYFIGPHPYEAGKTCLHDFDAERIPPGGYRPPTDAERAAFKAERKAAAAARPKAPPLINPTKEDAAKLQTAWNLEKKAEADARRGGAWSKSYADEVCERLMAVAPREMTQATYSERSAGDYGPCKTVDVCADWTIHHWWNNSKAVAFRVRIMSPASDGFYTASHVVILSDKPGVALPARETVTAEAEKVEA